MRLAWLLLAASAVICSAETSTTLEATSTTTEPFVKDETTTTAVDDGNPVVNTESTTAAPTAAPVTDGPTDAPNTGETKEPVKTTAKEATTTLKTTVKAGSTTTKEPQPDVESFSVKCDKASLRCTYTMQVPGLDIDTYNKLIGETNETSTDVDNFAATDFVNLQAGVTQVFADADATADYVASQLATLTAEIAALETQATQLSNAINGVEADVYNANKNLQKILNKKGSCLYRQCILKETTTPRPTTTTTVRTTPTPFCLRDEYKGICQNGGECNSYYDSYYCDCTGNLDGQDNDCATSACEVIKASQPPGLIFSPGYLLNTTNTAVEECDQAQWTVTAKNKDFILNLAETSTEWTAIGNTFISKLSTNANLQLTVGKYKLKITKSTKYAQITQILGYGNSATISYSGPAEDFFHFTIKEEKKNP